MQTEYHDENTESKFEHCGRCGSVDLREQEKPPHIGLYCKPCGAWVKWLPPQGRRAQLKLASRQSTAEKNQEPLRVEEPAADSCGHCPKLDALIAHLGAIDRELTIIVRALIHGSNA